MRVIRASGTPRDRGLVVGSALRDEVAASVAFTFAWAAGLGADRDRLDAMLAPYDAATARFAPDLSTLLDGMADGAGVDRVGLRATNAFEELYAVLDPGATGALPERCTDALVPGPDGPLLVHQEQWYAADADSVVIAPVVASGLPLVGMNAAGTAVGAMSLTAADERVGVPRMVVARRVLDATDQGSALRTITTPERAGGYTYALAFADGSTAVVESTATTAADLAATTHTNHALDRRVAAACPAPSDGSASRLARIRELTARRGTWTIDDAGALLGDHGATGQDICVHPDPSDGPEASAIMFGMVADVANRTVWIAPGNPCRHAFEPYAFADLVG